RQPPAMSSCDQPDWNLHTSNGGSSRMHGPEPVVVPKSDASSAGFSATKLRLLDSLVQGHVDARRIPGAIVMVARRDRVGYFRAFGTVRGCGSGADAVLRRDTIFWLASMTKPIVSVAVLMLMEEGKIDLDDCASKFIPEFAAPRMVRIFDSGVVDAVRKA